MSLCSYILEYVAFDFEFSGFVFKCCFCFIFLFYVLYLLI